MDSRRDVFQRGALGQQVLEESPHCDAKVSLGPQGKLRRQHVAARLAEPLRVVLEEKLARLMPKPTHAPQVGPDAQLDHWEGAVPVGGVTTAWGTLSGTCQPSTVSVSPNPWTNSIRRESEHLPGSLSASRMNEALTLHTAAACSRDKCCRFRSANRRAPRRDRETASSFKI